MALCMYCAGEGLTRGLGGRRPCPDGCPVVVVDESAVVEICDGREDDCDGD